MTEPVVICGRRQAWTAGRGKGVWDCRGLGEAAHPGLGEGEVAGRALLTVVIFLPDIVRADERGQPPHVPLEDALVHWVVCGGEASVCGDSDGVGARQQSLGLGGGGHGGIMQRQGRRAGRSGGGRRGLQRQPVVMVTEDLVTGFAALAAAAAAPASGEGAAEGSRRFLIPRLQQVPLFFAGLVVPPQ